MAAPAAARFEPVAAPPARRPVSVDPARPIAGHCRRTGQPSDRNGRLTLQEFQAALQEPAKVAFAMADTNNDGQLTEEEGARAMGQLVKRLGIQPSGPQ